MWKDFIIMLIIAMFLFQNGWKQRRNIDGGGISQRLSSGEYYPKTMFHDHYMNFLTLSDFDQDDELSKMLAPNVST